MSVFRRHGGPSSPINFLISSLLLGSWSAISFSLYRSKLKHFARIVKANCLDCPEVPFEEASRQRKSTSLGDRLVMSRKRVSEEL
jgi:hypothetical protein